ncbi:MAG: FkbM family methyltransferase [Thermoproteales archaeon]|nr:FkbM family methyltransferase [Thermoproteales archaeon]
MRLKKINWFILDAEGAELHILLGLSNMLKLRRICIS